MEETYGYLAYHVIRDEGRMGVMYVLFCVSPRKEDWKHSRWLIKDGMPEAFVTLLGNDAEPWTRDFECGLVIVKPFDGGLLRIE